jgi:hypothetical protein
LGRSFADGIVRQTSESVFSKIRHAVGLAAGQKARRDSLVYRQESDYGGDWRVSLGPDQPFAPPPPTLREHLTALGHPLETPDEIERVCRERDLPLDELDVHLNGFGWEDSWDNFTGPQAKAHHLLKGLDLGGAGSALRQAGQIIFEEFGGSPGNSYTWVELHDDLTVSLLQARLIELNLPINVAVGARD